MPTSNAETLVKMLEVALDFANQLSGGTTSFHIECALDKIRSQQLVLKN
jgi:hypothetical protein